MDGVTRETVSNILFIFIHFLIKFKIPSKSYIESGLPVLKRPIKQTGQV